MFRRRDQKSFLKRCCDFLWPTMGWGRASDYWAHRVSRLPGSVYSIAAGFACGAAISFTPFVGLHFILGGLWAWSVRGNIIASAIGTAIGNPWTFPFIWVWIYKLGGWLGFGSREANSREFDFAELFGLASEAALKFDLDFLAETAWPILRPMLVGSVPTVILMWFLFFYAVKYIIYSYRNKRLERSRVRQSKNAQGGGGTTPIEYRDD